MDDRPDRRHDEWLPPARIEVRPYADPGHSIAHDKPPAPKRNDGSGWLIPIAIVMAGIVLAFAVVLSRRAPQSAPAPVFSPFPASPIQTFAPSPSVVVPSPPPETSAGDSAVLRTLEDVVAAARSIRTQTGSYVGATSFELARILPANIYQPPTGPSVGPTSVSVSSAQTMFAAAAMSATGTCFWIRDSDGTTTTYGVGIPCTGTAATGASLPTWPTSASPSGTPTITP